MRLLTLFRDGAGDQLSESRSKRWRLLLDLLNFMIVEGRSSAEFLDVRDSPFLIRRESERRERDRSNPIHVDVR
jgi:hypothetical protein